MLQEEYFMTNLWSKVDEVQVCTMYLCICGQISFIFVFWLIFVCSTRSRLQQMDNHTVVYCHICATILFVFVHKMYLLNCKCKCKFAFVFVCVVVFAFVFVFWIKFCCCCTRSGITLPPAPSNGNTSQSATKDIMFQNTSLWLTLTKTLLQRCGINCQLWHISYGRKWPRRLNPSKLWNSSKNPLAELWFERPW